MSVSPLQTTQFNFETISDPAVAALWADRLLHFAIHDRDSVYQYLNSLKQSIDRLELEIIKQQIQNNPIWDFYPTPQSVINTMFEFVSFSSNINVLEPDGTV